MRLSQQGQQELQNLRTRIRTLRATIAKFPKVKWKEEWQKITKQNISKRAFKAEIGVKKKVITYLYHKHLDKKVPKKKYCGFSVP